MLDLRCPLYRVLTVAHGILEPLGKLIVGFAVQFSARTFLVEPAPLLEEERHVSSYTLVAYGDHPFPFHGSSTSSTLAADYDPVNASQLKPSYVFQQRLDGKETHRCWRRLQIWDSCQTVTLVLDADAPPNVSCGSGKL